MIVERSRRSEWTDWNPDDLDVLRQKLESEEPIPPLDVSQCPRQLNLEDILMILSIEHPDAFKDIRKRMRDIDCEIADFEMYNKLIMSHNFSLHKRIQDKVNRFKLPEDFEKLQQIADSLL